MIIDVHTHVLDRGHWPTEWWHWVAEDWAAAEPERRPEDIMHRIEPGLLDPDGTRLVASMDAAGVDLSVVLPIDWGPDYSGTLPINDVVNHTLDLQAAHPDRILAFGGIDPRRPNAADLVSDWFERGAHGLKLYPSAGWHPLDERAAEIYRLCEDNRLPVLFHTGNPLPVMNKTRELSRPAHLADIAAAFPNLPIWLGHAGAPKWWDEALELAQSAPNVRLEMSVWIWDDSTVEQRRLFDTHLTEALQTVGAEQIIFGTDNVSGKRVRADGFLTRVLTAYRELPERLADHGVMLSATELELILGGNAAQDLGIGGHIDER